MDRSQYLVQALQGMGAAPQNATASPDLGAMKSAMDARRAWEAANPGQSYMAHSLKQAGQAVAQAPGAALGGLSGLMRLGAAGAPAAPR